MAEAARAAGVSVGTLYHYFSDKRALLLYGINPEPANYICERFRQEHGHLARDIEAFRHALADLIVDTLLLMRGSVDAAIAMGPEVVRDQVDAVTNQPVEAFESLIAMAVRSERANAGQVERAIRRSVVSALMEKDFAPDELRIHFKSLLS